MCPEFQGDSSRVEKVKRLMKEAEEKAKEKAKGKAAGNANGKENIITISDAELPSDQMHFSTKRLRSGTDTVWVCIDKMCLNVEDKDIILQGLRLTDKHINATQKLLKRQFTFIHGSLKVTIESHAAWIPDYFRIFHTRGDHWIMLTTMGCHENKILIFDSLYDDDDAAIKSDVEKIFLEGISCYQMPSVPKQEGPVDCGLYALSYAIHIAYGRDPHHLTTS